MRRAKLETPPGESPEDSLATTVPGYAVLGMEHILGGWDHLAFVLALLLLATSLREVLTLVTALTMVAGKSSEEAESPNSHARVEGSSMAPSSLSTGAWRP